MTAIELHRRWRAGLARRLYTNATDSTSFDLLWICRRTCCTTSPRQIESQQQVHNRSPQQVVRRSASLTTSWTTCRTANPQLIEVVESDLMRRTNSTGTAAWCDVTDRSYYHPTPDTETAAAAAAAGPQASNQLHNQQTHRPLPGISGADWLSLFSSFTNISVIHGLL